MIYKQQTWVRTTVRCAVSCTRDLPTSSPWQPPSPRCCPPRIFVPANSAAPHPPSGGKFLAGIRRFGASVRTYFL